MDQIKRIDNIEIDHGVLPSDTETQNEEGQPQITSSEKTERLDPNRPFDKPEMDQLDHLFNIIGEPANAANYITRRKEVRDAFLEANLDPNDKDIAAKRRLLADEIFKIANEDYDGAK